ncbi:DUF397 domain-containing protein [Streptomyces sp. AM 4-1-1]|uniref:DUF397 domain-containing protein n=1 Tax=Streptomyces sp. AM 4-1-1 TaxID=3028710 RepID=UPI0023B90385|nr:DUF397 domain-containing protein [Streptomyces sp. AM 4-1-1]WEH34753.1 DUF397 domain-containing protein [Streptomyces sp. AM 4-1-1]
MTPEIITDFRKSSYSDQQGDCLEVAETIGAGRIVCDSKRPGGSTLPFSADAWTIFIGDVCGGSPTGAPRPVTRR